jgi:hypothetical protein
VLLGAAHGDAAIGTRLVCNSKKRPTVRSWIRKRNVSGATGFGLCCVGVIEQVLVALLDLVEHTREGNNEGKGQK